MTPRLATATARRHPLGPSMNVVTDPVAFARTEAAGDHEWSGVADMRFGSGLERGLTALPLAQAPHNG